MPTHEIYDNSPVTQNNYKKISLFSGRFQPPHAGHVAVWKWLSDNFDDAYIITSDLVNDNSPFDFLEKQSLFAHAGIPPEHVVKVQSPYNPKEIMNTIDPQTTVILFAVGEKDMDDNPRFEFKNKKDGRPSYLQSYKKNVANLRPASEHAYVITVPTTNFKVGGRNMMSATEFRNLFSKANDSEQMKMIIDTYGKYSDTAHQLLKDKLE